ncbi:hypothetical protein FHD82_21850 [Salmonella enterica]|nr:hypothetical protein [Salmonella enterica]
MGYRYRPELPLMCAVYVCARRSMVAQAGQPSGWAVSC